MTKSRRAIIIGCGIAGGALALALRSAGYTSEIYEARSGPTTEDDGLFLNTASNGVAVLKLLGLAGAAVAAGAPCPRHILRSGNGKRLGEITNGLRMPGVEPSVLIKRGVLQGLLENAAVAAGARVHFGKRLIGVTFGQDHVIAQFDDGSQADGDILIGCDGIHSPTRSLIDPLAPLPRYTGLVCMGGYLSESTAAPTPETLNLVFGRSAFFGYLVAERGETYWFSNIRRQIEPSKEELTQTPVANWQKYLLSMHHGDADPIKDIIAAPQRKIVGYPIYDVPSVPIWHRERAIIIGDAAHATSPHAGQGASMALEDAVVLARCLRDAPSHEQAFARYERLRRGRVDKIVEFAHRMGLNKKVSNPMAIALRDAIMPHILSRFATEERRSWIYDYPLDGEATAA